jgi:nitroreductase
MSNAVLSPSEILQQLQWRYATKKFDPAKKIPDDVWSVLEKSLVLAPSSFGLQPWKFLVVRNPDVRKTLVDHAWGQTQVVDASHLIVFAAKNGVNSEDVDRHLTHMAEVQGVPVENLQGFGNMVKGFLDNPPFPLNRDEWATRQVYIALAQFLVSAAMLGVDTCPMEGFIPAKFNDVLGLTEQNYSAVVLCTAGYRAEDDKHADRAKVRYPQDRVIDYVD